MLFDKESERYLMLDEEDFKCLVRGGVLHWGNIKIALKDIGFYRINMAIESAESRIDIGKDHVKRV